MSIREAYEQSLRRQGHEWDAAQEKIVNLLADLQWHLQRQARPRRGFLPWVRRSRASSTDAVPGIYLWGGVGRGKTFLMDLFHESLTVERSKRIHFHRMMRDVHARLKSCRNMADPLDRVAGDIANEISVLCFDEFFVSDIGDAMILARLLDGLFRRGVTLVTTSNVAPDDLYGDGLQRQRFLPAIDLLKRHCQVVRIEGETDYRLRLLQEAGTFFAPADDTALGQLQHFFDDSASSRVESGEMLEINGRPLRARQSAKGIAWFEFDEICDGPRSQNDYIEIARWYPTVIISAVPVFNSSHDDQARRFIALVDEFYDRRVKLILSADATPQSLYRGERLAFEFERTASRLLEMQTTDYLVAPHLA